MTAMAPRERDALEAFGGSGFTEETLRELVARELRGSRPG